MLLVIVIFVVWFAWLTWEGLKRHQLHYQRTPLTYNNVGPIAHNSPSPVNVRVGQFPLRKRRTIAATPNSKESSEVYRRKENRGIGCMLTRIRRRTIKPSEADECLEKGDLDAVKELLLLFTNLCGKNPDRMDFFQKLAECCLYVAERTEKFDAKKEIIDKGISACDRGLELDNSSVEVHKWYAGLLNLKTWMVPLYESKDEYGAACVHHLDIALTLNSKEGRLHHFLGRILYQLAEHSRSGNDGVSFTDALASFLQAHRLHAAHLRERKENSMFLGKCYLRLRDFRNCAYWLREARNVGLNSHPDICHLNEEINRLINIAAMEKTKGDSLRGLDLAMVDVIKSSILVSDPPIQWEDIAGLEDVKMEMKEAVVYSITRPDLFTELCEPPKGILLFGPPGTGKTLIGKCVASQTRSTFFNMSVSSLTSKWVGEGEKMIRTLFAVAKLHQPAVIFIDEIDALLSRRGDSEHESSRKMKAEFLVAMDGITTGSEERLLVIGATNRPQDIDPAIIRRFKELYIPLPELEARTRLVADLVAKTSHLLAEEDFGEIAKLSRGYSGADLKNVCAYAAKIRIRPIILEAQKSLKLYSKLRPLAIDDFRRAFENVKASVLPKDLDEYASWSRNKR